MRALILSAHIGQGVNDVKAKDLFKEVPPAPRYTTGLLRGLLLAAALFGGIGAAIGLRIGA